MDIECEGFRFISNFDSSNIDRVELVPYAESSDSSENNSSNYEFNIWTRSDCAGTEYENTNRTWFYFGIKGGTPSMVVKLNIVNLNRQCKLYSHGMAPVYRITPGRTRWERIKEQPSFLWKDNLFSLSFNYQPVDTTCSTTYFAFTYPFSFSDLQNTLKHFELRVKKLNISENPLEADPDDIYFHRECLVKSIEGRCVDLITVTSHHGITCIREPRLSGLFPDNDTPRPYTFTGKKVIFLSARVHPGETPSSFVMNGILKLLLNETDIKAIALRKLYIFKLIPMLNPDGVCRGNYRTDTRGANLNRFYLKPSRDLHPTVFGAKSLILYYHFGREIIQEDDEPKVKDSTILNKSDGTNLTETLSNENEQAATECQQSECVEELNVKVAELFTSGKQDKETSLICEPVYLPQESQLTSAFHSHSKLHSAPTKTNLCTNSGLPKRKIGSYDTTKKCHDSGLFLYIDFHSHASRRGIFMYGNHFDDIADKVECMLLPKLMSINNQHFHYTACNFSKRNMYMKDRKDGMSREGSGRVAVMKSTGLIRSYTLECNYNTGHKVNVIPPMQKPLENRLPYPMVVPPKYTPQIFEDVGRAICVSVLDMVGSNPNTRLTASQYRNLNGLKEAIRIEINTTNSNILQKKRKKKNACPKQPPVKLPKLVIAETIGNASSISTSSAVDKNNKKESIATTSQIKNRSSAFSKPFPKCSPIPPVAGTSKSTHSSKEKFDKECSMPHLEKKLPETSAVEKKITKPIPGKKKSKIKKKLLKLRTKKLKLEKTKKRRKNIKLS